MANEYMGQNGYGDDLMGALANLAQQLQVRQHHMQQPGAHPLFYPQQHAAAPQMALPPHLRAHEQPPEVWTVPAGLGVFSYTDASSDLTFRVSVLPQSNFVIERLFAELVTDDAALSAVIGQILVAGKPQTPDTGQEMPWTMFQSNATYSKLALKAIKDGKKFEITGRVTKVPATGKVATISWGAYGRMLDTD